MKKEPESDDDIQFMGALMEGSYDGPRALVESIKQEYISPKDLDDYNKFATEKDKLVIIQEKIQNVYNVRKVFSEEQLEKLLKCIHSEWYKKNIRNVDTLKQNIADSLNKASNNVKEDDTSCKQLEDEKVDAGNNAEENIEVREEGNRKAREEAARKA